MFQCLVKYGVCNSVEEVGEFPSAHILVYQSLLFIVGGRRNSLKTSSWVS